ncbi:alpha/beta hydrolase [Rhodococcus sp. ARC_M6]|uniref:alpha/beta hydrolase n=1 Tax=Rhodococcus sp. ARC_M6 TaxID=2928852 RepID=UPI001FB4543C|nr:alpha/beta hydrolase [Rhodococcus sp. ARC_M6]MCJ0901874.1 alpha/beta hydrolase family protein [Rhodococcus sp. ARC_M6]
MDLTDIDAWDADSLADLAGGLEGMLVAHRVRDLQHRLAALRVAARDDELQVRADGEVRAAVAVADGHPLQRQISELSAQVSELIAEAVLVGAEFDHARASVTAPVSADFRDNVTRVNKDWRNLCADGQAEIVKNAPELIANLDGIPAAVRDVANRARIDTERRRLQDDSIRIQQELQREFFGGRLSNTGAGLWYAQRKLEDLDALEELLREDADFMLVMMDMRSGERGFAAVAVGDPGTADHLSVTVPGLNTNVKDSMRGMALEARRLRDEAGRQLHTAGRGHEKVCTIAWIGYDAPQMTGPGKFDVGRASLDVSRGTKARIAADALSSFFHGLRASSVKDNPHFTALGHSYGSLATSLALQRNGYVGVADVVFYGSPGVRAREESQLEVAVGHVYVMKAEGDAIAGFGRFGGDPSDWSFQCLSTRSGYSPDGIYRERAFGHAEYARTGDNGELRMTGYNLAVVIAGLPERAVLA